MTETKHPYWNKLSDNSPAPMLNTSSYTVEEIPNILNALACVIGQHMEAQGFWDDENDVLTAISAGCDTSDNYTEDFEKMKSIALRWKNAEKYMLIATELTECIEGDRAGDNSKSEEIPEFTQLEEEMADIIIRVLDFAHRRKLRIGEAFVAKMNYNASRPFRHGKKF